MHPLKTDIIRVNLKSVFTVPVWQQLQPYYARYNLFKGEFPGTIHIRSYILFAACGISTVEPV